MSQGKTYTNTPSHLHVKAITSMAVECRSGTKQYVEGRRQYGRPTVDLVGREALDCAVCSLHDDTVVVARQTVVELDIPGCLRDQNAIDVDSER